MGHPAFVDTEAIKKVTTSRDDKVEGGAALAAVERDGKS
jgi:hypothetical protein